MQTILHLTFCPHTQAWDARDDDGWCLGMGLTPEEADHDAKTGGQILALWQRIPLLDGAPSLTLADALTLYERSAA